MDASRHNTLTDLVRLAVGVHTGTGEVLATVEWLRSAMRPFQTAIQMVDTPRLSNPSNKVTNDPTLRAGLEQNMMQVVLFAALLGIALMSLAKENARPLLDLLRAVQAVTMVVVHWAMYLVPLAVFGLLAQITTRLGLDALIGVSVYVFTVLLGLAGVFVMYLVFFALKRRQSPLVFLRAARLGEDQRLARRTRRRHLRKSNVQCREQGLGLTVGTDTAQIRCETTVVPVETRAAGAGT